RRSGRRTVPAQGARRAASVVRRGRGGAHPARARCGEPVRAGPAGQGDDRHAVGRRRDGRPVVPCPQPDGGAAVTGSVTFAAGPTAARSVLAEAQLASLDPGLVPLSRRELPRARDVVARRLLAAALREGLIDRARAARLGAGVSDHGFDRLEPAGPMDVDPAQLLDLVTGRTVPAV